MRVQFYSKSEMVFCYIKPVIFNYSIMKSVKVGSTLLKSYTFSPVLQRAGSKISITFPRSPVFLIILVNFCHSFQRVLEIVFLCPLNKSKT